MSARASEAKAGHSDRVLFLIAAFKLVKAAMLIAIGVGALGLVHRDARAVCTHWVQALALDPGNRLIHRVLEAAGVADARRLEEIGIGSFLYAAVFVTEGIGLLLRKRWAEYMTTLVTLSFLPFELYEFWRRHTPPRALAIVVNAAVVVYLIVRLRRERREAK